MNLERSGPWATPYAHSFCDKFLGALRHTTPSILRQRGSAATMTQVARTACLFIKCLSTLDSNLQNVVCMDQLYP